MAEVFVVYTDVCYLGYGDESVSEQRRIDCVVDTIEKARARVHDLNKLVRVSYADYEVFEVK
jgi:hypothetical protein